MPTDKSRDTSIHGWPSGHGSQYGWLSWLFGGLTALGVPAVICSVMWSARANKRPRPLPSSGFEPIPPQSAAPIGHQPNSYQPTDQGIRLEQLKTIAALRESGALTEAEFEAEKRRILES